MKCGADTLFLDAQNLGCAKAQPGRAAGVAGGDGDSCLEASNTKDSRSDLVENTKTERN